MIEKIIPAVLFFVVAALIVWMVSDKYDFEREK
jgi:hypothetical protein